MENIRAIMSGCMETDKPLISILMAVYEPRMDWLREQLESLNAQTYPNLRLYICDDCSPTVHFEDLRVLVEECITKFPFILFRNETNLGSNKTFEHLTKEAEGELFAYCDQDDIWLPEKLDILQREMDSTGALLVCSDMYVIDENGKKIADSITQVRRHHIFCSGSNLAKKLLFRNFVTGCTMLVKKDSAKKALPFCPFYIHDHYLALWCAEYGKIESVLKPLIFYRIHHGNQTLEMAGVKDRRTYQEARIDVVVKRMSWLKIHLPCSTELLSVIEKGLLWAEARQRNWEHKGGAFTVLKYSRFSLIPSLFELAGAWMPEPVLMWFVNLKRKNKV